MDFLIYSTWRRLGRQCFFNGEKRAWDTRKFTELLTRSSNAFGDEFRQLVRLQLLWVPFGLLISPSYRIKHQ